MTAPEGSDRVACEVDIDGRTHDRDKDYGVVSGEFPPEEGNGTGDQEGIRDKGLRPKCGFDALWRVENEKGFTVEVSLADSRIPTAAKAHRDRIQ